jgi:hypothetical protein
MIAELLTLKDLLPDNNSSMRVNGTGQAPVQETKVEKAKDAVKDFFDAIPNPFKNWRR